MLSVALIVKNEEKNLARCLDSLTGLWDELVIIDTGSTDKTVEIAKKYTDKVYFFQWIKDFAAARNFSFSKCTQPWIMWVDADDILHPEDVKLIREQLPKIPENIDYILMNYHYHLDSNGKPLATQLRERIIRQGKGVWAGRCHEIITVWFERSQAIEAAVWHCRDLQDIIADRSRNIEIMKLEIQDRPTDRNYYYLAQEHSDHGQHLEAIEAYSKAFDITTNIDTKFQAAFRIGRCYSALNNQDLAIEWFFRSLQYHVGYREPLLDMATIYMKKGDYSKAVLWAEASLKVKKPQYPIMIIEKHYYDWLPHDILSKSYFALKEYDKAIAASEEVYLLTKQPHILQDIQVSKNAKKITYKIPDSSKGPIRLNLGSGSKTIPGFINCDLFPAPGVDEIFSLDEIPYADGTIDEISSEHALEHLPRLKGEAAIKEWYRVLKPEGRVDLKIPDLEACCERFLNDRVHREWYSWTLYGIQSYKDYDYPFKDKVNYGQVHYFGFSTESIASLMMQAGFVVESITKYDGFDTPSLHIKAHKPCKLNLAVYMPYAFDPTNPSIRLRRLNLQKALVESGIKSEVVRTYEGLEKYDNVLVSHFDKGLIEEVKSLKQKGKRIYQDHCENLWNLPYQAEAFSLADVIVCCSTKLAEITKGYLPGSEIVVVPDMYEI